MHFGCEFSAIYDFNIIFFRLHDSDVIGKIGRRPIAVVKPMLKNRPWDRFHEALAALLKLDDLTNQRICCMH